MQEENEDGYRIVLGFKFSKKESATVKKYKEALKSVTTAGSKLALTLGALSGVNALSLGGIFAKTTQIAEASNSLANLSKNIGISVTDLMKFEFAITQAGGSSELAKNSFRGLARAIGDARMGGESGTNFARLGINPFQLKDTLGTMDALLNKLSRIREGRPRQQIAASFGIDPTTLNALIDNSSKYTKAMWKFDIILKKTGLSLNDIIKKSIKFRETWKENQFVLDLTEKNVFSSLSGAFEGPLNSLNTFLENHQKEIKSFAMTITNLSIAVGSGLFTAVNKAVSAWSSLDPAMKEVLKTAGELLLVFKGIKLALKITLGARVAAMLGGPVGAATVGAGYLLYKYRKKIKDSSENIGSYFYNGYLGGLYGGLGIPPNMIDNIRDTTKHTHNTTNSTGNITINNTNNITTTPEGGAQFVLQMSKDQLDNQIRIRNSKRNIK